MISLPGANPPVCMLRFHSCLFFLLLGLLAGCAVLPTAMRPSAAAPPVAAVTTVYLVRHGEKDLTPDVADPLLLPAGRRRAVALRDTLTRRGIAAIFTTDTRRTRDTAGPLEAALQLTPLSYDAAQPALLAEHIRRAYAGKSVLVVGHSNTLLPLIEAFGVTRPMKEIPDARYDYLFEIKLPATGAGTIGVKRYGAKSE